MAGEHQDRLEVLSRIITLETKLAYTIEKLDRLVDIIQSKYEGDSETPSIMSRLISLEQFNTSIKWSLGVIYTSIIGILVKLLMSKL